MFDQMKYLPMWGAIIIAGFVLTQILFFFESYLYIPIVWVILVILGFGVMSAKSLYGSSGSREGLIWMLFVGIGFILTTSIVTGMFPVDQWNLGPLWLMLIGLSALMEGYSTKKRPELMVGIFWVVAGVVLFGITKITNLEFIYLGLVFGLPMIFLGIKRI
jgi:hypothetical protein